MNIRTLAVIAVLALAAAWWLISADDEALVREAHATLAELVTRTGAGDTLSVLQIRALQQLFADPVVIVGDAQGLRGTYTPEALAGMIIRGREVSSEIGLSFGQLTIDFPADEAALTAFAATLETDGAIAEIDNVETRRVVSRMAFVDGAWRFTEFRLSGNAATE